MTESSVRRQIAKNIDSDDSRRKLADSRGFIGINDIINQTVYQPVGSTVFLGFLLMGLVN